MEMVQNIALLKKDPMLALKKPLKYLSTPKHLYNALPKKVSKRRAAFVETTIDKVATQHNVSTDVMYNYIDKETGV